MTSITIRRAKRAVVAASIVLFAAVGIQATTERSPFDTTVPAWTSDRGTDHAFPWLPNSSTLTPGGH